MDTPRATAGAMTMTEPIYLLTGVTGATAGAAARELCKQGRYQDGIFAGTNDVIETITGKPPLTLEEFVARNCAKFAI